MKSRNMFVPISMRVAGFTVAPGTARSQVVAAGQAEPAESNDSAEGRQNNRRVVLIRN
jgi:flagellar motor protein MotB